MTILGIVLFFIGFLLAFAGGIWTLVLAFMDHVGWGVACFFIPFATWVFIFKKWHKKHVKQSFYVGISGLIVSALGGSIASNSMPKYIGNNPQSPTLNSENNFSISLTPIETPSPSPATTEDPFREAVNKAMKAAQMTQKAKGKEQWIAVATAWQEAITLMEAVPADSPNYPVAQQKAQEYQKNLAYAQNNAENK